jgi:hypothetical protein
VRGGVARMRVIFVNSKSLYSFRFRAELMYEFILDAFMAVFVRFLNFRA